MKRLFRKNQIIITALAIMIVIAGYLNFTADQTKPVKKEAESQTAEKLQAENIQAEEAAADAEADITSFPDEDLASVSAQAETVTDTETPEILLDAKGFKDSVVSINDDSVDVIIGATSITEEQRAQIEDIVTRKTERNVSDIVITTME